jgi:hypothetical protein
VGNCSANLKKIIRAMLLMTSRENKANRNRFRTVRVCPGMVLAAITKAVRAKISRAKKYDWLFVSIDNLT